MSGRKLFGSSADQRLNIAVIIIIFAGVTIYTLFHPSTAFGLAFGDDSMTITGPDGAPFAVTVSYEDILSVSQTDSLEIGTRLEGLSTDSCRFGTWENESYGSYTLCAVPSISNYIVLETREGMVAFNYESADTTSRLYAALLDLLEDHGQEA